MGKNLTSKKFVTLKGYKGQKLSYNEDRTIQNETQLIKTEYNTNEWKCLMLTLAHSGFCKIEIEKVNYLDDDFSVCEDIADVKKDIEDAFNPKKDVELTEDQKRIAELEKKLAELTKSKDEVVVIKESDLALEDLRVEYTEISGKKPHHLWKEDRLVEEIDKLKK